MSASATQGGHNNRDITDDHIDSVCVLCTTALSPNLDSYVFVKIVNDVAGIVIEEETGDAGYEWLSGFEQFSATT